MTIATEEEQFLALMRKETLEYFFYLDHDLPGSTVVLRIDNTDYLVIILGCKQLLCKPKTFNQTLNIWLQNGM